MSKTLTKKKHTPPLHLRKLRADMTLKHISLRELAAAEKVPYVTASAILSGAVNHAEYLARLMRGIARAPMPAEVAR